jgi:hypothetical protein
MSTDSVESVGKGSTKSGVATGDSLDALNAAFYGKDAAKQLNDSGFKKHRTYKAGTEMTLIPLVSEGAMSKLKAFYDSIRTPKLSDGYVGFSDVVVLLTPHVSSDCMATVSCELVDTASASTDALPNQSVSHELKDGIACIIFSPNYCIPVGDVVGEKKTARTFAVRTAIVGATLVTGSSPVSVYSSWDTKHSSRPSLYAEGTATKRAILATKKDPAFKTLAHFRTFVKSAYDMRFAQGIEHQQLGSMRMEPQRPVNSRSPTVRVAPNAPPRKSRRKKPIVGAQNNSESKSGNQRPLSRFDRGSLSDRRDIPAGYDVSVGGTANFSKPRGGSQRFENPSRNQESFSDRGGGVHSWASIADEADKLH